MSGLVRDGDEATLQQQNLSDAPLTGYVVWPSSFNPLTAQRTFVQDMAQRNAVFRPNW